MNDYESAEARRRRVNTSGGEAREAIAELLAAKGYNVQRRVPIGEGIYGTELRADVVVEPCLRWPAGLIVQVHAQGTSGSADQKFPYFVANVRDRSPIPTVMVLVGDGFSPGSVDWLLDQVDGERLIGVLSLDDFEHWVSTPGTV